MLCRLCLYSCSEKNAVRLFGNQEKSYLTKLIERNIQFQITKDDAISTIICRGCLKHFNALKEFLLYVEERQKAFHSNPKATKYIEENCQIEISDDESVNIELNDESLKDINDLQRQNELSSEDCQSIDITTEIHSDEIDEDDVPLNSLFRKGRIEKTAKGADDNVDKTISIAKSPPEAIDSAQSFLTPEEDKLRDEQIAQHIQLKCETCIYRADNFKDLKTHTLKEHDMQARVVCCGRNFWTRALLWDHIQYHLNSEYFKCTICNKILKTRLGLETHHIKYHTDRQTLKHACSLCGKRFAQATGLSKHMLTHSSERKYNCELCKKAFKSNHMLQSHKSIVHDQKCLYMCDICGKEYKHKYNFDSHVAEHEGRGDERNRQCPICLKWLRPGGYSKHLKIHNRDDIKCNLCGKQVKSEGALRGHIWNIHKMKKIFSCTFCDKAFKSPRALKEHIGTHTGAKDYSCPHCTLEFRARSNMYTHIRKVHLEEWTKKELIRKEQSTKAPEGKSS